MYDSRVLLDPASETERRLGRRAHRIDLEVLRELVQTRRSHLDTAGKLRAEANRLAKEDRGARPELRALAGEVKRQIREVESECRLVERNLKDFLLAVPNLPADDAPDGDSGEFAVEVSTSGPPRIYSFEPRHHADIGESTGIVDLARAGKLSGARFSVTRGAGAALERALAAFFLDLHTREHGYVEHSVPSLVTRETMTGTGQLPKFEEDLFATSVAGRELFLIPTAEVPLTNLYAGETIDAAQLPLALTAHTRCFRAEAGSYGRDTRGLVRLHEFGKVELVRICRPEESTEQLRVLLAHAEECLVRLGLDYRVVRLAAGDLGFSAHQTYDIEVWLPGQGTYREISSCSDCGTFQALRARISTRGNGGKTPVATLNGSGLPIGRCMVAILEQYQQEDGGVLIPAALRPYTGFARIAPDGTTET
jgi:seryl-tRNA synthetase